NSRSPRCRPVRPARSDRDPWRRHGHAASGEARLWQGAASRRGAVHALLHGLAVGPQMGGAGDPSPTAGTESPVGLASAVCAVLFARGEQETGTSPQDTGRSDATTVVRAVAVVSPAEI